jgi:hypothetical protein
VGPVSQREKEKGGLRGAVGWFAGLILPGSAQLGWVPLFFLVLLFFSIFLFPVLLFELAKVI